MIRNMSIWLGMATLCVAACEATHEAEPDIARPVVAVSEPMSVDDAYAAAEKRSLPATEPIEGPGLHHLFWLGEHILVGSEPHGEEALKRLSEMGIKTALSTDGKVPDQATAAKYGIRYVHVPIKYSGISRGQLLRIAKTFRELEAPFYVHCFHGKHRGPAGAAVGRLVLDGVEREQAVAEMRQWCGTAAKYSGLYGVIGKGVMPTTAETAAFDWDFPAAHELRGFRHAMIAAPRAFDNLKALAKRDWAPDPEHPDLDAVNEAAKLQELFAQSEKFDECRSQEADFREWLTGSTEWSTKLQSALKAIPGEGDAARARAKAALGEVKNRCAACHKVYRNE
jgi:protein tyrosine phosphatase (PTP) superfamily phosphohydrolase (DUF442 family)/cytochrome c556